MLCVLPLSTPLFLCGASAQGERDSAVSAQEDRGAFTLVSTRG